jgi:hypothetical protein
VADRVDARIKTMQSTDLEPVLDRPCPQTQRDQLPATDYTVLASGELTDLRVFWALLLARPFP